ARGGDRRDRPVDGRALALAIKQEVFLPPVAVRENVVPCRGDGSSNGRVPLERDGAGKDGRLDVVLREETKEAPHAGPTPVLEHRFVGEVGLRGLERDRRGGLTRRFAPHAAVLEAVLG